MALTNKGKIKINETEYDVVSCKVKISGLEAKDAGRTDDGIYHYNYTLSKVRTITVQLPPCSQETVGAILKAVQGKTYTLTYFDMIDGEKTIQAHTKASSGSLYSGVLLNGLWNGVSFIAEEVGGESE